MKPIKNYCFKSSFAEYCSEFLNYKRSLGYKYNSSGFYIHKFDEFCATQRFESNILTKEIVVAWEQKRPLETSQTHNIRITILKQFALFLSKLGHYAYLSTLKNTSTNKTYVPYIFTHEEILRIFDKVDKTKLHKASPFVNMIIPVIFRMLYGCGLRISEALKLKVCDVDLKNGVIIIKNSKFDKDRIVPMSPSLFKVCYDYSNKVLLTANLNDFFFSSPRKGSYHPTSIYGKFRFILWQAGISHGGRGKGPRLHDLRHTFAVHCLHKWIKEGKDINCMLPLLSTYLGHNSISSTQDYLRLTAEFYPDVLAKVERHFGGAIPDMADTKVDTPILRGGITYV